MGEVVDMVTEGTPQGSPTTMEMMEDKNPIEGEFMATPTMELEEEEGKRQEGPRVEEIVGPVEEATRELGHEVDTELQEPT